MRAQETKPLWFKIEKIFFVTDFVLQTQCAWLVCMLMNSFWSKVASTYIWGIWTTTKKVRSRPSSVEMYEATWAHEVCVFENKFAWNGVKSI